MVNRDQEESVMGDDILDVIWEAAEAAMDPVIHSYLHPDKFEQALTDLGYMIVPIEDPTNLRFGVED